MFASIFFAIFQEKKLWLINGHFWPFSRQLHRNWCGWLRRYPDCDVVSIKSNSQSSYYLISYLFIQYVCKLLFLGALKRYWRLDHVFWAFIIVYSKVYALPVSPSRCVYITYIVLVQHRIIRVLCQFPSWTEALFFFKSELFAKLASQALHWKGFFPSWTDVTCLFKSAMFAKEAMQVLQSKDLFVSWTVDLFVFKYWFFEKKITNSAFKWFLFFMN